VSTSPRPDWESPGPEPVAPGIHRIPLPMPSDGLRAVNVYLLSGPGDLTLIDGGWAVPEGRAELERALDQLGHPLSAISRILVTHAHRDHYTLAVQLRREFGIPVSIGAGERPTLDILTSKGHGRFGTQGGQLRRAGGAGIADQLGAGFSQPDPDPPIWEQPDHWLSPGLLQASGRDLRVLPTPGHTRGHIVFADEAAGLLFAGDHVLPHITPSIGFEAAPAESPLADYLSSLELIRKLPDLALLPAHGWVTDSTHARIAELIAHHDQRLREMAAAVGSLGAATAAQVAASIGWTRRHRSFGSLDVFNQMLAVTETFAHLNLLAADGVLTAEGDPVEFRQAPSGPGA
jgi:glyoxylase-like metal-dependent hydrolase (beta-lactamase superfamily II)